MTKHAADYEMYVPLDELSHDFEAPEDSGIKATRVAGRFDGIEPLVESIRALGQIVPMVYQTLGSKKYVIAGNRRLYALRQILGEESNVNVLAMNADSLDGEPAEVALADNIIRSPLHMVDKFEAFAGLVHAGHEPEAIASRFSIRVREVEQALAVARLAPEVREAWRANNLSEAAAQAFTLEPDLKRQAQVFKKLAKASVGANLGAYQVRRELVGDDHGVGRFLAFVGVDAYEAVGGQVLRDLFADKHAVTNPARLKKMADEKLAAECHFLVEAKGWAFAVVDEGKHYGWKRVHLDPAYVRGDKARLAELRKQLSVFDQDLNLSDDDERNRDRVTAELEAVEREAIERAWTPKDRAKVGCVVSIDAVGGLEVEVGYQQAPGSMGTTPAPAKTPTDKKAADKERAKAADAGVVSKALDQRLAVQMRAATKLALTGTAKAWEKSDVAKAAGGVLPIYLAALVADLIKPENNWQQALTAAQMDSLRAGIDPAIMNAAGRATFDAKDYFDSIPKANLVAVIREIDGNDEAARVAKLQVAAIKKVALSAVKPSGWLPTQLRTPHYDAAGSGAPKKKGGKR